MGVNTRGQCALLFNGLSPYEKFEITVIDMTMLCHMTMRDLDGH